MPKSFQSWELLRGRKEFGIITLAGERLSGFSIMEKQLTVDE